MDYIAALESLCRALEPTLFAARVRAGELRRRLDTAETIAKSRSVKHAQQAEEITCLRACYEDLKGERDALMLSSNVLQQSANWRVGEAALQQTHMAPQVRNCGMLVSG